MSIITALRHAREHSGITLVATAERSGVGATNLSAIENGRRTPTTATAERIADALGVVFIPVLARGRNSVAEAARAILDAEGTGNNVLAYRQFIQLSDDLAAVDPATAVALSLEEPDAADSRWTDALAALVEYQLTRSAAPLPLWVTGRTGRPHEIWEPQRSRIPLPVSADLNAVAEPFLRRGIGIEENELESA